MKGNSLVLNQMKNRESNCIGFRTCKCIKRLIFVMNFYDEWCRKQQHKTKKKQYRGLSLNDVICGLPCYNLIQLWNDFVHAKHCHFIQTQKNTIWEAIQVWDYVESKLGARHLSKCDKYARNNRNRSVSGTAEQRKALFYGFTEPEEVVAIQFCDVIWEFIFHSKILFKNEFANKILYDSRSAEEEDTTKQSLTNTTKQSRPRRASQVTSTIGKRMLQRLEKQKSNSNTLRRVAVEEHKEKAFEYSEKDKRQFAEYIALRKEIVCCEEKKSKFVTNVLDDGDCASFGVSFVYWKGYSRWHTFIERATFSNLREEMLSNPYYQIALCQWQDSLIKSVLLKGSAKGRRWVTKNAGILNKRYAIPPGVPISVAHIQCILLYVNYRDLQFAFKWNGCSKWSNKESTNDVKTRNRHIGNWYKLFTECITLYGDISSKQDTFYHGFNKPILFDAFKPNFKCMISTTSSLSVAQCVIPSAKGIIIELQQKRSLPYGYLDVGWCSDFQNECEKIFSFSRLDIVDIYQMKPSFSSNTVDVKALILFQSIMKGQYFQHTLHPNHRYQRVIITMIENWMNHNNESYLQSLFASFVAKQDTLYVIRSEYDHLCADLRAYLIDFVDDSSYEFAPFLLQLRVKLLLMKEFRWQIAGDVMTQFKQLPTNNTIKGKYFHAGNDVVLYPRLRRSDRDFADKSMMFCYVEDMPSNYKRIYIQWEIFCQQTSYHSSHTQYLKKDEFAGYTVGDTKDLCCLDQFTFQIAVHIIDIDKK